MLTEDYLIRMINLAIAALLRLARLKRDGQFQEAQAVIDLTMEQLLGLRSALVKELDDERLYHILTRNDRMDTRRLAIVAELFQNEGDLLVAQGRLDESIPIYARAMRYSIEACFQDATEGVETSGLRTRIHALAAVLDPTKLGADTLWPLAGYYEEIGEYVHAEGILLLLAQRPDLRDSILPELISFYERLLEKPAGETVESGLEPTAVREKLAALYQ